MKTTVDVENTVYGILNVAEFKSLLSGAIYNGRIPVTNSVAGDVLVSSDTITFSQFQEGLVSIKIWAQDIGGFVNPSINLATVKAIELVNTAAIDGYEFEVIKAYTIPDSKNPGWSIGIIRIDFFIKNL